MQKHLAAEDAKSRMKVEIFGPVSDLFLTRLLLWSRDRLPIQAIQNAGIGFGFPCDIGSDRLLLLTMTTWLVQACLTRILRPL